jgi:signal transduction histidine kinase
MAALARAKYRGPVVSLAPVRVLRLGLAHAPWSRRAWRDTAFVAAGAVMLLPAVIVPLALLVWVLHRGPSVVVLTLLAAAIAALPAAATVLTAAQRGRFWALLGIDIPRLPEAPGGLRPGGVVAALRSRLTWRQVGYHVLVTPAAAVGGVLTLAAWGAGAVLTVSPLAKSLTPGSYAYLDKPWRVLAGLSGVALLFAAPWLAAAVARLDTRAALALLGPSRAEQLERRVESLAESRAGVVDAADAERRRIERDLHDGAQRRLVSLAMNLGMARADLHDLPEEARNVIVEAHEEAKLALAELRDLVRGLHPAILEDRGLDAALSGIAARSPVPVRLRVEVPARATPTVEAVAYFVVSEALTNIAKHAQAGHAEVAVDRAGDLLRVVVTDDGVGGADPARGTGLAGLARRADSVDGSMTIDSPAGGPTTITVELPCGL